MGVTAGIFLASILLKEMRYLVYIRYLCVQQTEFAPIYVARDFVKFGLWKLIVCVSLIRDVTWVYTRGGNFFFLSGNLGRKARNFL
jgi:hypothetical protein